VPFMKVRSLTHLLSAHAIFAADIARPDDAANMLAAQFAFARAVNSDGSLVSHMIRQACLQLACNVAERCVNRVAFNADELARIADAMPEYSPTNFASTLRSEHGMAIWAFEEVRAGRDLDGIIWPTKR